MDYETIQENFQINIFDNEFKNSTQIIIAEMIGTIPKNFPREQQQLSAYTFYPPLNAQQIRVLAIDNITSREIKRQISEKVYKQLEIIFEDKIIKWNSVIQTTAKKFVSNSVEDAVDDIRDKLLENIENQTSNIIIQRFKLVNNVLKIV